MQVDAVGRFRGCRRGDDLSQAEGHEQVSEGLVDGLGLGGPQREDLVGLEADEESVGGELDGADHLERDGADHAVGVGGEEGDGGGGVAEKDVAACEGVELGGVVGEDLAEEGGEEGGDGGGEEDGGEDDVGGRGEQVAVEEDGGQVKVLGAAEGVVVAGDEVEGLGLARVAMEEPLRVHGPHEGVGDAVEAQQRHPAQPGCGDGVDVEDLEARAGPDHAVEEAEAQLDEDGERQELAAPDGLLHGGGDQVERQGLQVGEGRVEDEARHVLREARGVEDGRHGAHAAAPQRDGGGAAGLLQVGDDRGQVVLLVVAQRDVLALGQPRPREVKAEKRQVVVRQQLEQVQRVSSVAAVAMEIYNTRDAF